MTRKSRALRRKQKEINDKIYQEPKQNIKEKKKYCENISEKVLNKQNIFLYIYSYIYDINIDTKYKLIQTNKFETNKLYMLFESAKCDDTYKVLDNIKTVCINIIYYKFKLLLDNNYNKLLDNYLMNEIKNINISRHTLIKYGLSIIDIGQHIADKFIHISNKIYSIDDKSKLYIYDSLYYFPEFYSFTYMYNWSILERHFPNICSDILKFLNISSEYELYIFKKRLKVYQYLNLILQLD